ncbi:MAG: hypothetical protein FWG45_02510 [Oscillospiraceae bacterium]|nr:hypothetical protein [Oscillospiraceae bacterium]
MNPNEVNNNDEISKMFSDSSDRTASFNNVGKLNNPAFTFGSRENFGNDALESDEDDINAKTVAQKPHKPKPSKSAKVKEVTPPSEPIQGNQTGFGFAKEHYHKTVKASTAAVLALLTFLAGAAVGGLAMYLYNNL